MKNLILTAAILTLNVIAFGQLTLPDQQSKILTMSQNTGTTITRDGSFMDKTMQNISVKRNINDIIWVLDSIHSYAQTFTGLSLKQIKYTLERDENGNPVKSIKKLFNPHTEALLNKYLILETYYDNNVKHKYLQKFWDFNNQNWGDTTTYIENNKNNKHLIQFYREWNFETNKFESGSKYVNKYDADGNETYGLVQKWNTELQNWENYTQHIFNINQNSKINLYQQWNKDDKQWQNQVKIFNELNSDGNIINALILKWDIDTKEWVNYFKKINSYTTNGKITRTVTIKWNIDKNKWENYTQQNLYYDSLGHTIKYNILYWDLDSEEWVYDKQYLYSYNYKYKTLELTQIWDKNNKEWHNVQREVFKYDSLGNKILSLAQSWNRETSTWKNKTQTLKFYNNQTLTKSLFQYWNDSIEKWINKHQWLFTENSSDNTHESLSQKWDNDTKEWINDKRTISKFDIYGNYKQYLYQSWERYAEEWIDVVKEDFFWSKFETSGLLSNSLESIKIYPNPASEFINIITDFSLKNNYYQIISASGEILESNILNENYKINISNLPKGVYFLNIVDQNKTIKFMKF